MLRIRLSRTGKKRQPSYRVVVADIRSKRDGRVVERIGHYNPLAEPIEFRIEEARALHWLNVGAQPSNAVHRLLAQQGTYDRLQRLRSGADLAELVAEVEGPAPVKAALAAAGAVDKAVVAEVEQIIAEDEEE